jgi:hypothetical protein
MKQYTETYNQELNNHIWMGIIVDNKDPLKQGRVKVRVFGKFDDRKTIDTGVYPDKELTFDDYLIDDNFVLPVKALPWVHQRTSTIFAGGEEKGYGSFSFPKLGSLVRVEFINNDLYSGEYNIVVKPNKKMLSKLNTEEDYENSHVLLFDEDEDLWLLYTKTIGYQFYHKGSQIVIRPDSSIFIEHKDSTTMVELKGSDIKIIANRDIDITSDNKVTINSPIVHVNGENTYIGEAPSFSAVNGEPLMELLNGLGVLLDGKLAPTPGVAVSLINASRTMILSNSVKTSL